MTKNYFNQYVLVQRMYTNYELYTQLKIGYS